MRIIAKSSLNHGNKDCFPLNKNRTKRGELNPKRKGGRIGPPFPIKSLTRFQQTMDKIYSNERNRGRGTQGRRPGEQKSPRTDYKSRNQPNISEGVFIPAGPVRPVRWTGQTGWLDQSDRCQGPVRPVGLQHPLYMIPSDG